MEAGSTTLSLSVLVGLVILNAVLSAAHASLVNIHKAHLRELAEDGNRQAKRALAISEDATRLLATRQFMSVLIRFIVASILTLTIAPSVVALLVALNIEPGVARWLGYGAVLLIGALLMVLFGEMIPIAFATTRPDALAMFTARPMGWLLAVLSPISRVMLWLSNQLVALFGGRGDAPYVTEEEIKTLVDAGSEEGVIEDEEKEMIYSIFQFGDTLAREIMLPRIDIVALEVESTLEEALDTVLSAGHSRIPIYEDTIDSICGLLYAKDLLLLLRSDPQREQQKQRKVREVMRPAYFVPESKKAGALLEDLQQRKIHMAIVIDEYGGTAGLVTIEDLIEEIVGDIQDEYDHEAEAEYVKISDDEYVFDAGIHLDDVNELLDVELPTDESDTLGGYVFSALGKVPLAGEVFNALGLEIKVEAITGRRIRKVRVRRLPVLTPQEVREAEHMASMASIARNAELDAEAETVPTLDKESASS